MIISKADFTPANFVKFSQNIREDQVNPYINAAQENELQPRLGAELYADVLAEVAKVTPTRPQLIAFVNTYVKRFLVLAAYYRFMASHGINITQFGVSKTSDPQNTFDQITPQERAIILRQTDADLNTALLKMMSVNFVFDGVSYVKSERSREQSFAIRAPKNKKKNRLNAFADYGGGVYEGIIND